MATRAKMTLDNLKATKQGPLPMPAVANPAATGARRGQTLRLSVEAWKALKMLAIEEEKTSHDLIIEALNDLFVKHRLPPIA